MKKTLLGLLAISLMVCWGFSAWAMESEFGGYWRTRFYTLQNLTGEDETEALDFRGIDTRSRLYYTAIFSEHLKFVNKFEFDAVWGTNSGKGTQGYGDIGADGVNIEIKNSYADFDLGPVNFKVGVQGMTLARGLLFDDDGAAMVVSYNGENFSLPIYWMKAWEGGVGDDKQDLDVDYYGFFPTFNIGDQFVINPFGFYVYTNDSSNWVNSGQVYEYPSFAMGEYLRTMNAEEINLWYAGLSFDMKTDMFSLWLTGIYEGGTIDFKAPINYQDSADVSAWLALAGAKVNMNWGDIHGQFFYATGQDPDEQDREAFWVPSGQSYYWAEIMGYGIFDDLTSRNAPADQISNIMAGNIGVSVKPLDNVQISLDAWYASLNEDVITLKGNKESYLGTEIDLLISIGLMDGLNLDLVGAYLIAGEATTLESEYEADPYEFGAQLSLSF